MNNGILYSSVSYGTTVLANYACCLGNFMEIATSILEKLRLQDQDGTDLMRKTYSFDSYMSHFIRCPDTGFTYLCITQKNFDSTLAFRFLEAIQTKFSNNYIRSNEGIEDLKSAPPFSLNSEFSMILCSEMKRISGEFPLPSSTASPDQKIQRIRSEVDQVRDVAVSNIESIIERGERLELLVDKTENLSSSAVTFKQTSRQLSRKMWWENAKWTVLAVICIILVIYGILAASCGGFGLPKCI